MRNTAVNPHLSFQGLHSRLVDVIRARVSNGELTERSFARSFGISQPHLHHVLKGIRLFSAEFADMAMVKLGITIWDLDKSGDDVFLNAVEPREISLSRPVPVLQARIGAGLPLPEPAVYGEVYPFALSLLKEIQNPIAARLANDPQIAPQFQENDLVLLDQSEKCRTLIDPESSYVVSSEDGASVRYIRMGGRSLYLASDATLAEPKRWTRIPGHRDILETVKARIVWIGREVALPPLATPH